MIRRSLLLAAPVLTLFPGCGRTAASASVLQARLDRDLFFVDTAVGGAEGLFLLDTGAPMTVLDLAFAARIGARAQDWQILKGAGGARRAWQANLMEVTPRGGPMVRLTPSITDLSPISRRMGDDLAGVIGCDLLSRFILTLDYRAGRASLSPPRALRPPAGATPMRFAGTPYVTATVTAAGASAQAEFQIDTGSNTAVEFWSPFAARQFPAARVSSGAVIGVAGSERTRRGRVDTLTVGGFTISDLEANFADETRPDDAGPAHGGIIGGPAWRGLSVTLDFPDRLFWTT